MKSKTKTSTSDGEELAGQYADRLSVRVARAVNSTPAQQATLRDAMLFGTGFEQDGKNIPAEEVLMSSEEIAAEQATKTSSPELATLAAKYLDIGALDHTDVENVRRLAASVLSQAAPK